MGSLENGIDLPMNTPHPGMESGLSGPRRHGCRKGVWLILPIMIYLGVFYFVPLAGVLRQSLFDPGFTLEHYRALVAYPVYVRILLNTMKISFLVSLACVVLGYPMAWAIVFARPRLRFCLLAIVMVPFWISVLVRTYSWMIVLGRYGVINKLLMAAGLTTAPLELMYNRTGVYIGMIYVMLPYAVLPIHNAMQGIDRDFLNASAGLGATPFQTFRRIFLPLSFSGVAAAFVLVFIISAGIFITPSLMGSPSDTMIAMSINAQLEMVNNWGFAGALSMVLLVTVCLILLVFYKLFGPAARTGPGKKTGQFRKRWKKGFCICGYDVRGLYRRAARAVDTMLFAFWGMAGRILPKTILPERMAKTGLIALCTMISLFLIFPVFIILPIGFSNDFVIGFPPESLGFGLLQSCFTSPSWVNSAVNSFKVALMVTLLSSGMGIPAAMGLARGQVPGRSVFYALFLSPLILPGIISAVSMYYFIAKLKLIGTLTGVVLAHTVLALPYVIVVMTATLKNTDISMEQASYSLGATPFQTFRKITLPLIRPGILTAAIFAFIASFDELITALFICGARAVTLPKKMWDGIRDEMDPAIAAVSVLLILLAIILMGAAAFMEKRQKNLRSL